MSMATRAELLLEIANCTMAIKAFRLGCRHLAPDGLGEAPGIPWIQMQQDVCRAKLEQMRGEK